VHSGIDGASAAESVPVLIVGGSLVGLSTAMLLGLHGIRSLAVERHGGTAVHPRTAHFHLRTLEFSAPRASRAGSRARGRRTCGSSATAAASRASTCSAGTS